MGGEISLARAQRAAITIRVSNVKGGRLEIVRDGRVLESKPTIDADEFTYRIDEHGDARRHWLRVDVRGADGRLVLIGNPIYFNRSSAAAGAQ
jgi:hypothetical protein